jgi:hypothetical protein
MEIEIDKRLFYAMIGIAAIAFLVLLGFLGRSVSPMDSLSGTPRLMTWQDWQMLQAERQYQREVVVLRSDADLLAGLLNNAADPVTGTVTASKITNHTTKGVDALAEARTALSQAAEDVRLWSIGAQDRDIALVSLEAVAQLLEPK